MNATDARSRGRDTRRARLLDLIDRRGLGGVVLRRPANFAWCTGGGDSRVENAIEAARMRDEQTPDLPVYEHPWTEDGGSLLRDLSGGGPLGFDVPLEGLTATRSPSAA